MAHGDDEMTDLIKAIISQLEWQPMTVSRAIAALGIGLTM
jgi:hypothetical protein